MPACINCLNCRVSRKSVSEGKPIVFCREGLWSTPNSEGPLEEVMKVKIFRGIYRGKCDGYVPADPQTPEGGLHRWMKEFAENYYKDWVQLDKRI